MKILIVVPCYNESKRLRQEEFLRFAETHKNVEFLFANDGSRDDTLEVLQQLCARHPHLHLLNIQPNGGKAEAVRKGMLYGAETPIMEDGNIPEYIAFWDADLATPLFEIPRMAEWMAGRTPDACDPHTYDIVMGVRLQRLGAQVKRKKMRHYLGRCFATCASIMLNLPVYDTQCGAKMFTTKVVKEIFSESFSTRWLFDVELLARYQQCYGHENACKRIYEFPLYQWIDIDGSQLKSSDFFKAPMELLRIRRRYKFN